MQKPNQPVLTNAGRQMLNDLAGSKGKITYTKAVMYGQDLSSMTIDQLRELTAINDSKLETKIGVSDIKLETVTIIASFSNATVMQDTTYSAIGWYASTTVDSAEKLIAVIPYEKPQTLIAGSNGKGTASTDIQLLIHIGDDVNVELRPIEEGLISEAELKNALTLLSSKGLLYLGDEITDATYQADTNCFDKISTTSIKRINFVNRKYTVYVNPGRYEDEVKRGWILTLNDLDKNHFTQIIINDENEKVAIRTTKDPYWTQFLNKNNLSSYLPKYLSFNDGNIFVGGIKWNANELPDFMDLKLPSFLKAISYKENDPSSYETIETGLYDKLLINHAQLMAELASYGKVKSVNGIFPDTKGNVDVLPQHFRFNNNEILNLPLAYDEDSKSVNLDISSLLSLISFNGGTVDPALYSSIDPELYDKLLISHRELNTKLVSCGMVKSVNGTQPDPSGDVTLDIDSLTYKDNMSDSLLVSHAQLVEALRDKANKEDINNAPFVKTTSSTPVTLNPGVTSTGKTLIYKSPTGNPNDDVYLATANDLNQKADKNLVYSKAETYSKDEATKVFGKIKTVDGITPDSNGNVQLNAVDKYKLEQTMEIAGQHLVQKVNGIAPTTDGNGILKLTAENIPNAVFGTSRSGKQLEINPSITVGSDRKGYMIRDDGETFSLASTDDLENMLGIYTVYNFATIPALTDLNHTLSTINSYARSDIDSGIYLFPVATTIGSIKGLPQEVRGDKYTLIKIINVYKPNSKDVAQQFQEIKQYEDYGVNEYRRVLSVDLNGQVKINSWYKFSGTKVD